MDWITPAIEIAFVVVSFLVGRASRMEKKHPILDRIRDILNRRQQRRQDKEAEHELRAMLQEELDG